MHKIAIDRSKRLCEEAHVGHNRFHPDVDPILEVGEGEEVVIETRDALDGQLPPGSTIADFRTLDVGAIHPLTGPVHVKGAVPGDAIEVEFLDIEPQEWGFSAIMPNAGFLRDIMTEPFLVHWRLQDGWATSAEIPGVRIPAAPFMGISAVAPSAAMTAAWDAREQRLVERGGDARLPTPNGAVPAGGACAAAGLRTSPPRENGGNFDVKQLTAGSKLILPVFVDGALFSTGDGHYAQGDGEVSITAIEMGATVAVRFKLHKGLAEKRSFRAPYFSHPGYFTAPEHAAPRNFIGAMGYPISDDGENDGENLTLAARNALLNMMELLEERGFTAQQAYIICSVACDLRISNVVDLPNVTVSALIPEAIFG